MCVCCSGSNEFLERIQLLANAFVTAFKSVFWVAVLMIIFLYMFAILAVNTFGEFRVERHEAEVSALSSIIIRYCGCVLD